MPRRKRRAAGSAPRSPDRLRGPVARPLSLKHLLGFVMEAFEQFGQVMDRHGQLEALAVLILAPADLLQQLEVFAELQAEPCGGGEAQNGGDMREWFDFPLAPARTTKARSKAGFRVEAADRIRTDDLLHGNYAGLRGPRAANVATCRAFVMTPRKGPDQRCAQICSGMRRFGHSCARVPETRRPRFQSLNFELGAPGLPSTPALARY
jgi:hypothetical protein